MSTTPTDTTHRAEADGRGLIIPTDGSPASLPADGDLYKTDFDYWLVVAGRIVAAFRTGRPDLDEALRPLVSEGDMPSTVQPMAFTPIMINPHPDSAMGVTS